MSTSPRVYVGNIPFDRTEQDIAELLRQAGTLRSFRLIVDAETLKHKGYGFAEFDDVLSARCAIRNLNDYDLGGRKLRVNHAEQQPSSGGGNNSGGSPAVHHLNPSYDSSAGGGGSYSTPPTHMQQQQQQPLPPPAPPSFPAGVVFEDPKSSLAAIHGTPVAPGRSPADTIAAVVDQMRPEERLEVLAHIKALHDMHPDQARALLQSNPQLAQSVVMLMLTCGLVDASALQTIVTAASLPPPQLPPTVPIGGGGYPSMQPPPHLHQQHPGSMQPSMQPMMMHPMMMHGAGGGGMPPMPPPNVPAPVAMAAAPAPPPPPPGMSLEQQQMLATVLALTPEQIDAMPVEQRAAVIALRSQLTGAAM
ncbi:hypothetical protein BC828DRAFT_409111 [Blastocladiella britannica]|nr:hypothetical protein BC828DRAFT_409111 [Blastocladiella britannica]